VLAQVYLSDLADLPRNPWALRGLQQVYQAQATPAAAQKLEQVRWLCLLLPQHAVMSQLQVAAAAACPHQHHL
jgi:hypothetical protein